MNNTANTTDMPTGEQGFSRMKDDWSKIFVTFYSVLLVFTVLGNTLVCVAIYVDRRLRSSTNWFIASLAVSDLLYGLVGLPFRIVSTAIPIPNVAFCKVWIWVDMLVVAASIANLAVISIDRYLKITKPFDYHRKMTKRLSFGAIGGVWAYAAILATFAIIAWPGAKGPILYENSGECSSDNKVFYTVANIVAFLFPLVVLTTSYTMILRAAWIQFKKMKFVTISTTNREENKKRKSVRRDFKATKTLAVVLGTFTVCWAPFFVMFTADQYVTEGIPRMIPNETVGVVVSYAFYLILPNLNSACNPVIYAYFNMEFRRAFSKIMLFICDPQGRKYGGSYTKRRSSLTSFFQSPFSRRGSPPMPNDDGNHNHNVHNKHNGLKEEDRQSFLNGDTMITQI